MSHPYTRQLLQSRLGQAGFTLLEVMVVVLITAILGGFSIMGLAQAGARRNATEAENLQLWLQQLYDMASLEGITYGVKQSDGRLAAVVFYHQRWLPVSLPEDFSLHDNARLDWPRPVTDTRQQGDKKVELPNLVVSAYPGEETDTLLDLAFTGENGRFRYSWNNEDARIVMESRKR